MLRKWINYISNIFKAAGAENSTKTIRTGLLQALPLWIASLVTGFIAIYYTKLFSLMEDGMHMLLEWKSWSLFIFAPLTFLLAWWVVKKLAPNARGSGIPQVMAAIELATPKNSQKIGWLLSIRILFVKIISSMLMVLGGGAIGREGPTIQIAGSVFVTIRRFIPVSWPKISAQNYILTGAAAGLAAAFNTPLGGIVFAMEELAKIHVRFFRTALFSAVIIAGLTAQAILGSYLYLGYPDVKGLTGSAFFGVILTAFVTGILGALMSQVILKMNAWRKRFNSWQTVAFVIVAGILMASLAFFISDMVLGSGKELINQTLFTQNKHVSLSEVAMRFIGPVICFNTGAASGIFAPSLAAGAAVGSYVASLFEVTGGGANILILGGMVGFLTGVTRTPFTSAILVLEMTDRHSVIFHIMVAAMISNIAALMISRHSLYDRLKKDYLEDTLAKTS